MVSSENLTLHSFLGFHFQAICILLPWPFCCTFLGCLHSCTICLSVGLSARHILAYIPKRNKIRCDGKCSVLQGTQQQYLAQLPLVNLLFMCFMAACDIWYVRTEDFPNVEYQKDSKRFSFSSCRQSYYIYRIFMIKISESKSQMFESII